MATALTDAERQRLAAILGMLGSSSAGERDNAARLAEQFRMQHGVTWEELTNGKVVWLSREVDRPVYIDREVIREIPANPCGMPPWMLATWCAVIGAILALWGHWMGVFH